MDNFEELLNTFLSNNNNLSKKRSRGYKRSQDIKYKNKLKKYATTLKFYPSPSYLVDKKWNSKTRSYEETKKPYYKRLYKGNKKNNRYSFYKKYSNKVIRRYKGQIKNGGMNKKIYDYWWKVD